MKIFRISDIKKIQTILHSQSSPSYVMKLGLPLGGGEQSFLLTFGGLAFEKKW